MNIELKENERIDDLEYKGLKIIQNKNDFCFGIDSILLSDFAKEIPSNSNILDLGAGSGVIGILLCKKTKSCKITGIEIQKDVCDMAARSIKLNNLEEQITIINENIRNIGKVFEKNSIDAIITNPPYKKENSGLRNENINKLLSRHEIECNLEDIIENSSMLLKDKGLFFMIHRPERLPEIFSCMKKYKIEPKVIRLVQGTIHKKPNMVLIKGIKNARGFLDVKETLIVYKENGEYTEEILKIYNKI